VSKLAELLVAGISLGFIYALIAMGLALIFKASDAANFAHGSLLVFGIYLVARLKDAIGFWSGLALALVASAAVGIVIEVLIIRRIRKSRDIHALFLVTVGLDIVMGTELMRRIGGQIMSMGAPWSNSIVQVGTLSIPLSRLVASGVAIALFAVFFLATKYSSWGVSMRAAAEDSETASLMGINLGRVSYSAWAVAAMLATVAGLFFASFPNPGLEFTTGQAALKAFPAVVIGGLDSPGGAIVGGLAVGLAEALVGGYQGNLGFLGRGFGDVVPYLLMFVVLLYRPSGLFGVREVNRV
jgi:branched-chain amino acid transport system permease protein